MVLGVQMQSWPWPACFWHWYSGGGGQSEGEVQSLVQCEAKHLPDLQSELLAQMFPMSAVPPGGQPRSASAENAVTASARLMRFVRPPGPLVNQTVGEGG